MNEIWLEVQHAPRYSVSSLGRVRNNETGLILKGGLTRGYRQVTLKYQGKTYQSYVHILVASEFLTRTSKDHEVNHIDGDILNNAVTNLEWVTHKENMQHGWSSGLMDGASL